LNKFVAVPDDGPEPTVTPPSSPDFLLGILTKPCIRDEENDQSRSKSHKSVSLESSFSIAHVQSPALSATLRLSLTPSEAEEQVQSDSFPRLHLSYRMKHSVHCTNQDKRISNSDDDEDPNADLSLESIGPSVAHLEFDSKANRNAKMTSAGGVGSARASRDPDQRFSIAQEVAYRIVDSGPSIALIFGVILIDALIFIIAFVNLITMHSSRALARTLVVMDILTAVVYCLEVNLRMFSYGSTYYFHSFLRLVDYVVGVTNATLILTVLTFAKNLQWLLVVRCIRLFRMLTVTVLTRDRKLKAQALADLEELAVMLDEERSEQSRLIKWRIDSNELALGEAAGKGGFGAVFLGLFRGTLVAVKQLYQSNEQAKANTSIEDEAVTLVNLRHPNVVLFMGFVHEPRKLWIVTEYCSRGSLRDLLDDNKLRWTPSRILKLALGAARGLAYLHGQDPPVLHLDLKTSNILISSGWETKLADFGLSRNIDNIQNNTFAGTIQYSAPEILESNSFSTAADVYSFGICMWEMAAREIPFDGTSPMEVLWGVVKEDLRPTLATIERDHPILATSDAIVTNIGEETGPPSSGSSSSFYLAETATNDQAIDTYRLNAALLAATGSLQTRLRMLSTIRSAAVEHMYARQKHQQFQRLGHFVPVHPVTDAGPSNAADLTRISKSYSPAQTAPATPPSSDGPKYFDTLANDNHPDRRTSFGSWPCGEDPMVTITMLQGDRQPDVAVAGTKRRKSDSKNSNSRESSAQSERFSNGSPVERTDVPAHEPSRRKTRTSILGAMGIRASGTQMPESRPETGASTGDPDRLTPSSDKNRDNSKSTSESSVETPISSGNSVLDPLTSLVAAKIQLFDDRPSVAKRMQLPATAPLLQSVLNPSKILDALRMRKSSNDVSALEDNASEMIAATDGRDELSSDKDGSTFQNRIQSFSNLSPRGTGNLRPRTSHDTASLTCPASSKYENSTATGCEGNKSEVEISARSESAGYHAIPASSTMGPVQMSDEYIDFIKRCWSKRPADRPNADEVVWKLVGMIDKQIKNAAGN
jgi:serine/threonine protein kinase